MPFKRKRPYLVLTEEEQGILKSSSHPRTEPAAQVERAKILVAYAGGESIPSIARHRKTNRPKVERCIDKALQLGLLISLRDLPCSGSKG